MKEFLRFLIHLSFLPSYLLLSLSVLPFPCPVITFMKNSLSLPFLVPSYLLHLFPPSQLTSTFPSFSFFYVQRKLSFNLWFCLSSFPSFFPPFCSSFSPIAAYLHDSSFPSITFKRGFPFTAPLFSLPPFLLSRRRWLHQSFREQTAFQTTRRPRF